MIPATPTDNPDFASLERRLTAMEKVGINSTLDNQSKDYINQIIEDKILDIVWNKYFHDFTFFEAAGAQADKSWGWDLQGGTSSTRLDLNGLFLECDTANTSATMKRNRIYQNQINFVGESRFRTTAYFFDSSNALFYLGTGLGLDATNEIPETTAGYGFMVEDGNLYGVTSNNTTYTTKLLMAITDEKHYALEAWYYPGYKVVFYASEPLSSSQLATQQTRVIERGTITATLPTGLAGRATFQVVPKEAAAKGMGVGYCEYIQKKST